MLDSIISLFIYQTDPLIVFGEWLHVSGTKPYPYVFFVALSDIQNAAATR
jgi:hypothetical protein